MIGHPAFAFGKKKKGGPGQSETDSTHELRSRKRN